MLHPLRWFQVAEAGAKPGTAIEQEGPLTPRRRRHSSPALTVASAASAGPQRPLQARLKGNPTTFRPRSRGTPTSNFGRSENEVLAIHRGQLQAQTPLRVGQRFVLFVRSLEAVCERWLPRKRSCRRQFSCRACWTSLKFVACSLRPRGERCFQNYALANARHSQTCYGISEIGDGTHGRDYFQSHRPGFIAPKFKLV